MEIWMKNRVMGCMLGGAVGDALGNPVEFYNYDEIIERFGERGITRYQLEQSGKALITDDTQMTLFTANGMVLAMSKNKVFTEDLPIEETVTEAYLEWFNTQTQVWTGVEQVAAQCWLSQVKELYARRAPGNTCLQALASIVAHEEVVNDSCGCGGLMRVAPVGLLSALNPSVFDQDQTLRLGAELARITHKHPLGYLPAALFAYLVREAVMRKCLLPASFIEVLENGIAQLSKVYPEESSNIAYLKMKISRAIYLSTTKTPDAEAIANIGEGWVADENLAIAIYCVLRHWDHFESAVVAAVNHSGDSDSTGAVTGNLMGALMGKGAIPVYYLQSLELREVIEEITTDMIEGFPDWNQGMTLVVSAWMQKYRDAIWPVRILGNK